MPYIPKNRRDQSLVAPLHAGELNYVFTHYLTLYLQVKGLSYQTINDIVGALDAAKAEFTRRVVVPYEDQKIAQNGDVYKD